MRGEVQSLFGDAVPSASAPARRRCPTCRAGYARQSAHDRVAAQRANAPARDYAAEWLALVEARTDIVTVVVAVAHEVARTKRPTMDLVWTGTAKRLGMALDHNLRAPAARWLMAEHAALAGKFRTRSTPGDPSRAR